MTRRFLLGLLVVAFTFPALAHSAAPAFIKHHEEVIYGHKLGVALTLDMFQPQQPNGAGLIFCVSGGWFSNRDANWASGNFFKPFLEHGYTCFAVYHGSQPKFKVPEILEDMHRSIRFIRHNAKDYGVDPNRLGIMGGSAGGHLSLMMGTTGGPGKPDAKDPVDRESSAIQCVACWYPPTDFLNYGQPSEDAVGVGTLKGFRPAFGLPDNDTAEDRQKLGKQISPVNFVTKKTCPTLIIHGDADKLVPIQQAELFEKKCGEHAVPMKLIRKPGLGHGWNIAEDVPAFIAWFDQHLSVKK